MMRTPALIDLRYLFSDAQWATLDDFCCTLAPNTDPAFYRLDRLDSITPGGYWGKDHPLGCMLLYHLLTAAIDSSGVPLRPCHSVVRYTAQGGRTMPHVDNKDKVPPYSLLMPISTSGQEHPFIVKDMTDKMHTFSPQVGEAVLLNATEMEHSRPPLQAPWHVHAILTYASADDNRRRSWEQTLSASDRDARAGNGWLIIDNAEQYFDFLMHDFATKIEIAELLALLDDPRTTQHPGYVLHYGMGETKVNQEICVSTVSRAPNTPKLDRILARIDAALDRPDVKRVGANFHSYKEGNFFAEHIDDSEQFPRCTSAVLLLSEADGGDLIINDYPIDLRPGTLVAFSGDVPHAVNVVRKGRRVSLVVGYTDR